MNKTTLAIAIMIALALAPLVQAQGIYTVASPDNRIKAEVKTEGNLRYSIDFQGKAAILESALGLEFRDAPSLGKGLQALHTSVRTIHDSWENPLGKRRHVIDNCRELKIELQETKAPKRRLDLLVRAYDDGVAFRYVLPEQPNLKEFVLTREESQFRFAGDPTVWAADYGGYATAQEGNFVKQAMSALSSDRPYGTPLLVEANRACYVALTEADLQDWAGMYLSRAGASERGQKLVETGVIRGGEAAQKIAVSVAGKRRLTLVIGDGGDDFICDHADWGDARLIAKDGSAVPLSSLKPLSATQGYGTLQFNRSVDKHPLQIGVRTYALGLGSHSVGEIVYALDGKYDRFEAEVGIDAEVGNRGSVTFGVYGSDYTPNTDTAALVSRLSPRRDGQGLVKASAPHNSPWRVIQIGQRPGDLIESDIVLNLSEPCQIADTHWIQPGKCAWDNWWSGDVKMDTPTEEEYVQFASEMGFPYQLVDWQWYGAFSQPDSDITHVNTNLDMPELRRFAKERNVRLFVWLHSDDVDKFLRAGKLDAAFALYESWGLAGVKIDFMNRDDQEMVNWYHTIIKMTAAHHLMLDFHGAYKPTGTQRTYPNQITREGVLGEEYDKSSALDTPEHDCTLPFTRMLAGPMDYTPGGFLNRSRTAWRQTLPTQVMGTRAHELAKVVIFDSPLMVLCDHPRNYRNQPGLEFLRVVPTVWDETRILDGYPGEFILSARRSGKDWFLGGMTNWDARTVNIPLTFLGKGRFTVHLFIDAPDADTEAEHLTETSREVIAADTLTIRMASGGGLALQFTPK